MAWAIVKNNTVENIIVVSDENAPLFGAVKIPDNVSIGHILVDGEWVAPHIKASREVTFAEIERMLEELRREADSK